MQGRFFSITAGLLFLLGLIVTVSSSPLEDYVNAPDPTYKWVHVNSIKGTGVTLHNIYLTSQTWLTANDTSNPVWTHWVQVCVPSVPNPIANKTAFIFIDGGNNSPITNPPEKSTNILTSVICLASGMVVVNINQIPNQPIVFEDDPLAKRRTEDALIAFSWANFLKNPTKPELLVRLPMTKAVVRAMDAVEAFVANKTMFPDGPAINKWIVAGASKRGWTSYTVAAVDKRVVAVIPIVIPVGNLDKMLNLMWQAYGNWSFALDDYVEMGITKYLNRPEFQQMMAIESPLAYVDKLKMPKYIFTAVGDEFFMPDAPNLFIDSFLGETHLRVVPNAEHTLIGHQQDVAGNILSFLELFLTNRPRPYFTYKIDENSGDITVTIPPGASKPTKVLLFSAVNYKKREFRLVTCADFKDPRCMNPIIWYYEELHDTTGTGVYVARKPMPFTGWRGMLVQVEYNSGGFSALDPLKLSTPVSIFPRKLPYPPCTPDICG